MSLMLLQESLWKIEDKLNVIVECIADHEAELIRVKRKIQLLSRKLEVANKHKEGKASRVSK